GLAIAAGEASAATNGYDDDGTTNAVTISYVSGTRFTANIWTQIPSTFAGVIGWDTLETSGSATAECIEGEVEGIGAIYAGGTCPSNKYGVDVPGSAQVVSGGVHTNARAHIGGSTNEFDTIPEPSPPQDDPFTHVGSFSDGGGGNVYEPGYPSQVSMPSPAWPADWDPSAVTGGGVAPPAAGSFLRPYYDLALANGTLFSSKVTSIGGDGVYYTTHADGMDIGSVAPGVHTVVLVAPNGPIKISASSTTLSPFNDVTLPRENILILSNMQKPSANQNEKKCDEYTISMSGSGSDWNGIIWAPGGLIEMSGSTNTTLSGTLIGWAVRLNGSNLTIAYNEDLFEGIFWIQMVD
ncbi:MAG TPA: hypothetical protein VMK30_01700, partial [Pleomorphomonadaceae bacterium]|nr:hypothetical protein [Pleomorphomonadaceae bacterium]